MAADGHESRKRFDLPTGNTASVQFRTEELAPVLMIRDVSGCPPLDLVSPRPLRFTGAGFFQFFTRSQQLLQW